MQMTLRLEKSLYLDGLIIAYKIRIMENQTDINILGYIVEITKRKHEYYKPIKYVKINNNKYIMDKRKGEINYGIWGNY